MKQPTKKNVKPEDEVAILVWMKNKKELSMPEQGTWHQERKKAILAKHPEIKELCKPDWTHTVPMAVTYMIAHLGLSIFIAKYDVSWLTAFLLCYTFGAWFCFVLQACGHEGVHGNVFRSYNLNRLHGFLCFLPLWSLPFETYWHPEHLFHHIIVIDKVMRYGHQRRPRWQKIAIPLVAPFFLHMWLTILHTILFVTCCVTNIMYAVGLRSKPLPEKFVIPPYANFPSMISYQTMLLYLISAVFWYSWFTFVGAKAVFYLLVGSVFSNGLHPLGMRNVQEHLVKVKNQPTYSLYYSDAFEWMHPFVGLNINYHVEHHDFATIPFNKLPRLRRIAPEFYENMNNYTSYFQVWKMFTFESGIAPNAFFDEVMEGVAGAFTKKDN
jgi:sphingolipid delta-4 desaturase